LVNFEEQADRGRSAAIQNFVLELVTSWPSAPPARDDQQHEVISVKVMIATTWAAHAGGQPKARRWPRSG
jgi:hypothetical protein